MLRMQEDGRPELGRNLLVSGVRVFSTRASPRAPRLVVLRRRLCPEPASLRVESCDVSEACMHERLYLPA